MNTKIHLKAISKDILKSVLHCTHTICLEKDINQELQFRIDIFAENGHCKSFLENLIWKHQKIKENCFENIILNGFQIFGPNLRHGFKKCSKIVT